MKTLFPLVARFLLAIAGFACTWTAAFNYSRLQLASAAPGPTDWGIVWGLVALSVIFAVARYVWRNSENLAAPSAGTADRPPWLVTAASERVAAGDPVGVIEIAGIMERMNGRKAVKP